MLQESLPHTTFVELAASNLRCNLPPDVDSSVTGQFQSWSPVFEYRRRFVDPPIETVPPIAPASSYCNTGLAYLLRCRWCLWLSVAWISN
jgi:hypothetical protein